MFIKLFIYSEHFKHAFYFVGFFHRLLQVSDINYIDPEILLGDLTEGARSRRLYVASTVS